MTMRHEENPRPGLLPEFAKKALDAQVEFRGAALMGADLPGAEPTGGQIFMTLEETFFAGRFAMLRGRFGTSWMLLAARATSS
jgi:PhnB protein